MKLNFDTVSFANFFSYGNTPTTLKFQKGINLITNNEDYRSNGIGKSSALMSIPFVLFGTTPKSVNKEQMVNWYNLKECRGSLRFNKEGNIVKIKRMIKPNVLTVTVNDVPLPQESTLYIMQDKLEEILGFNLQIFNNLIYCNMDNTISLVSAKANEKRTFLEKLFNLAFFSKLNDYTTSKSKRIEDKKIIIQKEIELSEKYLETAKKELKNCSNIPDFQKEKQEYIQICKKLKKLLGMNPNLAKHSSKKSRVVLRFDVILKKYLQDKQSKYTEMEIQKTVLTNIDNELIKLSDYSKTGDLKILEQDLNKFLKESEIDISEKTLEGVDKDSIQLNSKQTENNVEIKHILNELEELEKLKDLETVTECPTCLSTIDFDKIKLYYTTKKKLLEGELDKFNDNNKELIKKLDKLRITKKLIKKRDDLNSKIIFFKTNSEKYFQWQGLKEKEGYHFNLLESELDDLNHYSGLLKTKLNETQNQLKILENIQVEISSLEKDKQFKYKIFKNLKTQTQNYLQIIKTKEAEIEVQTNKILELNKQLTMLNTVNDYLVVVKTSLKDQHIKQFVIKDIMPYVNKQANEYLSNMGMGFYLKIDNWMDVEVKGPGIFNASLKGLSNGEQKSVDMAIKFALMDVAQMKTDVYPDILILDELLDNNIDEEGIQKFIDIIKIKQRKDDLKLFLTSHRKELKEFTPDHVFEVKKVDGFSILEQIV